MGSQSRSCSSGCKVRVADVRKFIRARRSRQLFYSLAILLSLNFSLGPSKVLASDAKSLSKNNLSILDRCKNYLRDTSIVMSHRIFGKNRALIQDPLKITSAKDRKILTDALYAVWTKHGGRPRIFNVEITDQFRDPEGKVISTLAIYFPEEEKFSFALKALVENPLLVASREAKIAIYAAHEATHMVQALLQGKKLYAPENDEMDSRYFNDPFEIEAWSEALDYVKGRFPQFEGAFQIGQRTFPIPEKSTYLNLN